jgi:hypothetical protein
MRAEGGATAAVELPSPEGLGLFVAACADRGVPAALVAEARAAIDELEAAMRSFPGGRSSLLAALTPAGGRGAAGRATLQPTERRKAERAERTARRAAFAAASFLHGLETETAFFFLLLAPGTRPGRLDQAMVSGSLGTRRLRAGPPITIGAVHGSKLNDGPPKRVTLAGDPITDDPTIALLPEFCAGVGRHVQVEERGSMYRLWLREDDPPIDRPVDLVYGVRNLNFIARRATRELRWACTNYTVCRPTRRLVVEVHLPDDVFGGRPPLLRMSTEPFGELDPVGGPPSDRRDSLDSAVEFRSILPGTAARSDDDPLESTLRRSFDLLRWDRTRFRRHRLEIEYPTMFVGMQLWYPLEGDGGGTSD